jgi:hypothetical protein
MHFRAIELDNNSMDTLHHLVYEADDVVVDFEDVENLKPVYEAMALMGKPRYPQGEPLHAQTRKHSTNRRSFANSWRRQD